jgi:tape measure domain-containing protein
MTAPIMSITNSINNMVNMFNAVESAANIDTSSFTAMRNQVDLMNAATDQLNQSFDLVGEQIRQNTTGQNGFNNSINQGGSAADGLARKIGAAVAAYASIQGIKTVLGLSDELTQTSARLNMINDGLQTTKDLQNMIFQSAQRSRGQYQLMADSVSKLGLMAGDAFGSNQEIIAFAEQLNKQFTIAGTNVDGVRNATLQLTQAMASGVLRGDELNSIFEQAPTIVQTIADYIGVPIGKIREMAAEGQITAEIVKNAMLSAADETNARFEQMPLTFGQIATNIQNQALIMFQPLLERLNEIANSPAFQLFVDNVINAMATVAGVVMDIFSVIMSVAQFASNNWSQIAPVIWAVVAALLAWKLATIAVTAVQQIQNAVMNASPMTWVIRIISALVAIIVFLANKVGGFNVLWQYVWTAIKTGALYALYGLFWAFDKLLWFFETIEMIAIRVWNGLVTGIEFAGAGIAKAAQEIVNVVLSMVNVIIEGINTLLGWAGVHIDTVAMATFGDEALAGAEASMNARNAQADMKQSEIDAARADRQAQLDQMLNDAQSTWNSGIAEAERMAAENAIDKQSEGIPDYPSQATFGVPTIDEMGGIASGVNEIANNTSDQLDYTDEEMKLWRDIAEREAINRFTTAEVHFDSFNVSNTVNSEMDLDGIINYISEKTEDALIEVANRSVYDYS